MFPAFGAPGKLVYKEQFAGIRGLSSDLAALCLAIIISCPAKAPSFILFTDVDGAYDNVWREALFAKLAARHPNFLQVQQIAALYDKMQSFIKDNDYLSELIDSLLGLAQGSPNSGHLFTFFMSDLPDELKGVEAGVECFDLIILC